MFVNMMGTYVVTTRMYAVMFANCIFMLISAVSQAGQVLIGYLVGARDLDGAYACGMRILRGLDVYKRQVIIQRSRAVCKGRFEKGLFPAFAGFFFAG